MHLVYKLIIASCFATFISCAKKEPIVAPVYYTPINDKVNLSQVSMTTSNVQITKSNDGKRNINFDYTVTNSGEKSIAFACLYNRLNELIEVNLSDAEGNPVPLVYNPLDELTLAMPKPLIIRTGETKRSYSKPIAPAELEIGSTVNVRIRLHTPSKYDELRSSLEPTPVQVLFP